MKHIFYYVVKPNAQLSQRIADMPPEDGDAVRATLGTAMILQRDRSRIPHELISHHGDLAKLAFIADLHDEYLAVEQANNPVADFLQEILGVPPYGLRTFDSWWALDVTTFSPQDLTELEGELSLGSLDALQATENPMLDAWLKHLKTSQVIDS